MSHFDGDVGEMPVPPLDDRALEALLVGADSVPTGLEWLVPLVEDLGVAASGSEPTLQPALATLLAEGFSTEKGDLPATAASNVTGPVPQAAGLPKWRKKMSGLLAGLIAKLAGLGLVAKVGLGLGVAAASVTGAGAAGALPDAAQHAVATVVGSATPFTFPDSADDHAKMGATVSSDATGASDGTAGVDGKTVSDAAKAKTHAGADTDTTGVGANTGATGLDRANQTPAAGRVPTSLPDAASGDGSHGSNGLDTTDSTPAADHVPDSVPPSDAGSHGLDTAGGTPAAGHSPSSAGRP
jgi:hypothetical protein